MKAIRYHRCRAADPRGQYFTIDARNEPHCSAGQVINIQWAQLGYSELYYSNSNPPTCPWLNCTAPTDVPATLCNGRRSCKISQTILIYRSGSYLCSLQSDGNFIRIEFTCVTCMSTTSFLYRVNYCDRDWTSASEITHIACNVRLRFELLHLKNWSVKVVSSHS